MKKMLFLVLAILLCTDLFAGDFKNPETDSEIKSYLIKNGFGGFTFNDDGRWSFWSHGLHDGIAAEGRYSVSDGLVIFETCDTEQTPRQCYYELEYSEPKIPGKYELDLEECGLYFKGTLRNVEGSGIFWSGDWAPPYVKCNYNGEKCIRYPWGNEGVDSEYILILENLKLRKAPYWDAGLVTVNGISEDVGDYKGERSIALAGQICTILAKTVEKDTIGGITAPWYLICASGYYDAQDGDEEGYFQDNALAFVFGGYVKEIKASELEKNKRENKENLKQSIRQLGGNVYQ